MKEFGIKLNLCYSRDKVVTAFGLSFLINSTFSNIFYFVTQCKPKMPSCQEILIFYLKDGIFRNIGTVNLDYGIAGL